MPLGALVFMIAISILSIIYVPQHYKRMSKEQYEPNNICSLYSHPMYGSYCDAKWLKDREEKRSSSNKWKKCNEKVKAKDRNQKGFKCVQHNCFNQNEKNIDPEGYCVGECPSGTKPEPIDGSDEKINICKIDCKENQKYFIAHKKCLYDISVSSGLKP